MIDIYLLEQLSAFYKYGTLSAAAEHLNLAQPSLSRSMQKLEGILGVKLFDRQKNRICLNQTGILAAEHAGRILEAEKEMEQHILAFDRSLHTLTIGSCAPGPLMELHPLAATMFSGQTIFSAIDTEERLIRGLEESVYSMILLTHPLEDDAFFCKKYISEQLCLSIPPFHPAAAYEKISFSAMDGQSFIMYAHVGFWEDIVRQKMPHSKFFLQADLDAVGELAQYSDLPSFSSDITRKTARHRTSGRIHVPFSDPESFVTYYLICRQKDRKRWEGI